MIESRDWEGLNVFSRSKKSPIGYEPFVEKLLASGNPRQALQYIGRCETQNRADLYVRAGDWVKAGEGGHPDGVFLTQNLIGCSRSAS